MKTGWKCFDLWAFPRNKSKIYVKASPPPTELKPQRSHWSVWVWTEVTPVWLTAEGKHARLVSLQAMPWWQGEPCSGNIPQFYLLPKKNLNRSARILGAFCMLILLPLRRSCLVWYVCCRRILIMFPENLDDDFLNLWLKLWSSVFFTLLQVQISTCDKLSSLLY